MSTDGEKLRCFPNLIFGWEVNAAFLNRYANRLYNKAKEEEEGVKKKKKQKKERDFVSTAEGMNELNEMVEDEAPFLLFHIDFESKKCFMNLLVGEE
jgi:hypothetical protein